MTAKEPNNLTHVLHFLQLANHGDYFLDVCFGHGLCRVGKAIPELVYDVLPSHRLLRMAIREIKWGRTIRTLCKSGSGFWKRNIESCSIGPTKTNFVVCLIGLRIVEVASV